MYVKPDVRRGLLGRMLTELLDTRVMVKQAMKRAHGNKVSKPSTFFQESEFLLSDPDQDTRRPPAGVEVHCQCDVRVHECNILG